MGFQGRGENEARREVITVTSRLQTGTPLTARLEFGKVSTLPSSGSKGSEMDSGHTRLAESTGREKMPGALAPAQVRTVPLPRMGSTDESQSTRQSLQESFRVFTRGVFFLLK